MHYETQRTSEGKLMEANGHFDIADAGDGTYSASFDNSVFGNSKILSLKKIPSDWKQQERLPDWQGCFRSEYDSDTDYTKNFITLVQPVSCSTGRMSKNNKLTKGERNEINYEEMECSNFNGLGNNV